MRGANPRRVRVAGKFYRSIRMTPSMASGIVHKPWTLADLLGAAQRVEAADASAAPLTVTALAGVTCPAGADPRPTRTLAPAPRPHQRAPPNATSPQPWAVPPALPPTCHRPCHPLSLPNRAVTPSPEPLSQPPCHKSPAFSSLYLWGLCTLPTSGYPAAPPPRRRTAGQASPWARQRAPRDRPRFQARAAGPKCSSFRMEATDGTQWNQGLHLLGHAARPPEVRAVEASSRRGAAKLGGETFPSTH
jgi:hypothetical protein